MVSPAASGREQLSPGSGAFAHAGGLRAGSDTTAIKSVSLIAGFEAGRESVAGPEVDVALGETEHVATGRRAELGSFSTIPRALLGMTSIEHGLVPPRFPKAVQRPLPFDQ
jgi:hypothetical protein